MLPVIGESSDMLPLGDCGRVTRGMVHRLKEVSILNI